MNALPYRENEKYQLYQGDCLQLLKQIPSASIDLIFADPPYNLSNGGTTCHGGKRVSVDKGAWDTSQGIDVDHLFHRTWLTECQRILKPSGTIWVSGTQHVIFSLGFAMQHLGFHLLNTVTWFKPNASPNLSCRFFTHSTELLIWAAPAKSRPLAHTFDYPTMKAENGGKQMRDVWQIQDDGQGELWTLPTPGQKEKTEGKHPTQKPLALLDRIVCASSKPGNVVLDPFTGSGTTAVAAIKHDRKFIGFDLNPEYLELTVRRLAPFNNDLISNLG